MTPRFLSTLVFVTLLSGCAQAPSTPAATLPSVKEHPLSLQEPVKVADLRNGQAETFIEVSSDGRTLLTCLHGEFKEPAIMYASEDGGGTWRELKATPSPGVSGDCEVALGQDGTWYFLHSTVAGATVAATTDRGRTWIVNPVSAVPINGLADRPWLEVAGDTLVLTYSGAGIAARTSTDRGRTWSVPQTIVPNERDQFDLPGHLVVASDHQTLYQPFMQFPLEALNSHGRPVQGQVGYAVSENRGQTWRIQYVGNAGPMLRYHPGMAAAAGESLFFVYHAVNGSGADVVVRHSEDAGKTWSEPEPVAAGLTRSGALWIDGRMGGSADVLLMLDGSALDPSAQGPHVALFRLEAAEDSLEVDASLVSPGWGEFFSVVHDAGGKAMITLIRDRGLFYYEEDNLTTNAAA